MLTSIGPALGAALLLSGALGGPAAAGDMPEGSWRDRHHHHHAREHRAHRHHGWRKPARADAPAF